MEDNETDNTPTLERQTSSDVKPFNRAVVRSIIRPEVDDDIRQNIPAHVAYDLYGDYYDMSGDKYLIIFNQHTFKSTAYFNYQGYSPRKGTFQDVESLQKTFGKLGFKVMVFNDLDYDDIIENISDVCSADHKRTSCVAVAIMTHGEKGGEVCASDRPYPVTDITNMLQHSPGLAGKPKLFFIQACRGQKLDDGQRIQLDGDDVSIVIPTHADCLMLYSSFDEHLSFRDVNGSWMIQALCSVISEHYQMLDMLQMITLVNRAVAFRFSNTPNNRMMHNKKQIPEARFTFTKFLRFPDA